MRDAAITNYLNATGGVFSSFSDIDPDSDSSRYIETMYRRGFTKGCGVTDSGLTFYCPAQWGTPLGANAYSPLLTTDGSGYVSSSYLFNPRMAKVSTNISSGTENIVRRYQKASDLEPHKLFTVDYLGANPGPGMSQSTIPHFREHGWNVLFTDGSVQFSQNKIAYKAITGNLVTSETQTSHFWYDLAFNYLEVEH